MNGELGPWRLIGMGWIVAACIVIGLVAGIWLDGLLHVAPLFTLLGLFVGLAAAFVSVYRLLYP